MIYLKRSLKINVNIIILSTVTLFTLFSTHNSYSTNKLPMVEQSIIHKPSFEIKHVEDSFYVFISPDERWMVFTLYDNHSKHYTTHVWDIKTKKVIQKFKGDLPEFSPDGKRLIIRSYNSGGYGTQFFAHRFEVRDITNGKVIGKFKGARPVFSPDGTWIVAKSTFLGFETDNFYLYSAKTGKKICKLKGVYSGFSPDGKLIITQSNAYDNIDREWEYISYIWDIKTRKKICKFKGVCSGFSPDGMKIITQANDTSYVRNITNGKVICSFKGNNAKFSPDGKLAIIKLKKFGNYTSHIYDIIYNKEICNFKGRFPEFSPDGSMIITQSYDHSIKSDISYVWNVTTGKLIHIFKGKHLFISRNNYAITTSYIKYKDYSIYIYAI